MGDFLLFSFRDVFRTFVLDELASKSNITRLSFSIIFFEISKFNNSDANKNLEVCLGAYSGDSGKGISLSKLSTRKVEMSLDNHANNSKHADTPVLELSPSGILQVSLDV